MRPALHFAPARNWMNDPNGLIQWGGEIHLFYQCNPTGTAHGNIAWGHASTTDLWRWKDHPVALAPEPDGPDRDGCFSGCAVVHDGRPYLLYTGVRGAAQRPCLAVAADDGLRSWERYERNPVIAEPPLAAGVRAFRDHCAWREGDRWRQIVGGGVAEGGALFLYESDDLRHWDYVGLFCSAAEHGLPGLVWECPDHFLIGTVAVVVVSVLEEEPRYAMWMTGEVVGNRFVPRLSGRCDRGGRYYAPQSLRLADGRRVVIGWLREALDELDGADRGRVGLMSLPRVLYVGARGDLRALPAAELDGARSEVLASGVMVARGHLGAELSARRTGATEVVVVLRGGRVTRLCLRLRGAGCPDVEVTFEGGDVRVQEGGRDLTVGPAGPVEGARAPMPSLDEGSLAGEAARLYYDGGALEAFGPDGVVAAVLCDRSGAYDGIELETSGPPDAEPATLEVTAWRCGPGSPP